MCIYILYTYIKWNNCFVYIDSLYHKPESWNEINHKEEISNKIPEKKLDYLEKAALLRYVACV